MIKAVIDTNIFVSSFIGSGNPYLILNSLGDKEFNLIISHALIDELLDVLTRPRFHKYFTYNDIEELGSLIQSSAQITSPSVKIQICRDPKDNIVLECAVAGEADYIVTGDDDLLCLNSYQNIRINPCLLPFNFSYYSPFPIPHSPFPIPYSPSCLFTFNFLIGIPRSA